jgi:hypothetical protein
MSYEEEDACHIIYSIKSLYNSVFSDLCGVQYTRPLTFQNACHNLEDVSIKQFGGLA